MRFLKRTLILLVLLTTPSFAAPNFPMLTGRVVDDAHVLSSQTVHSIQAALVGFQQATSIQLIVVTVPSLQGFPITEYSNELWKAWGGIGEKGRNNGVLFLIAPNEKHARIATGYGVEGVLTDSRCGAIIREVVLPNLETGQIEKAISSGVLSIIQLRPLTVLPEDLERAVLSQQAMSHIDNIGALELNGIKPFWMLEPQMIVYIILSVFMIAGGLALFFIPAFYLRYPLILKLRMWCLTNIFKKI